MKGPRALERAVRTCGQRGRMKRKSHCENNSPAISPVWALDAAVTPPFAMPVSPRAVFETLFRRHHRELLAFANRRVGPAAIQGVVQEAYGK